MYFRTLICIPRVYLTRIQHGIIAVTVYTERTYINRKTRCMYAYTYVCIASNEQETERAILEIVVLSYRKYHLQHTSIFKTYLHS